MKIRMLCVACLLVFSKVAVAQNCGGMPAVNGVCIPPDSATSPLNSTYGRRPGGSAVLPPPRRGGWVQTWGAIALDDVTGNVGAISGFYKKRHAEKEAIARCRSAGGKKCKVKISYYNQCVAISSPFVDGVAVDGIAIYQASSSRELAKENANSACPEQNDGRTCAVVYSDCALPIHRDY